MITDWASAFAKYVPTRETVASTGSAVLPFFVPLYAPVPFGRAYSGSRGSANDLSVSTSVALIEWSSRLRSYAKIGCTLTPSFRYWMRALSVFDVITPAATAAAASLLAFVASTCESRMAARSRSELAKRRHRSMLPPYSTSPVVTVSPPGTIEVEARVSSARIPS
jgi:hypothetical protein